MTTIHPTAVIDSGAVLGADVSIGPYCVLGPHATVGEGARLVAHVVVDGHTTIGGGCTVFPFASLGTQTQDLKYRGGKTYVEIGERTTIREYVTINAATSDGNTTRVGSGCLIMAYAHVAHDCQIGDGVIMANGVQLAGEIVVEEHAVLGGLSAVHQFVRIGALCMIGGLTAVRQDCPPFMMVAGNPAKVRGVNQVGMERRDISKDVQHRVKEAFRILYREDLSTKEAIEKIGAEVEVCPELQRLVDFVAGSERGIVR